MITEDYVSFEVAKLLKEKGFSADMCENFYSSEDGLEYKAYPAPTTQMALKWLMEEHNIMIQIIISAEWDKMGFYCELFKVDRDSEGYITSAKEIGCPRTVYKTEQESRNAYLKYALENLITDDNPVDFYSVHSREEVANIDKRIEDEQMKYDAELRDKIMKSKDFPMSV